MAQCTAPSRGHRTASGRANCPACSNRYGGYSFRYSYPSYDYSYTSSGKTSSSGNYNSSKGRTQKASWSKSGSSIYYTPAEINTLTPVRKVVEKRAEKPEIRDIFLCHAWDDRKESALELYNLLESNGVNVWFSEKDIQLGSSFLREIDKGLAKSKIGIVLVTPSFLKRVQNEGVAEKELSALLARDQLVPIVHNTTYDELRCEPIVRVKKWIRYTRRYNGKYCKKIG
ncbi:MULTISPECIES: toll/interleukin-1 receptor domain-containing protein [unclassified Leeuwenhoekiella]|uniref:toll/interleukin-1 receptor domain-containing protein n=1 Tax=unclassified Leeuwenhoekiella TaxID=2615029 RepID=UPI0025BACDD8|nr:MULTISPECIES: toll/interleukin-1 receptor domain-containing protein [unclassified Leeuwenhoekiella]|tara:strand:- start:5591 stop:6274 length:684 start_codon:yes stop_codon:yes gene_type:complete